MELYVHFPFCIQKCRYCDFVSYAGLENQMDAYADAVLKEAELLQDEITEPFRTVYFGGGTPSIFPVPALRRLMNGLRERLPLHPVTEWTAEANPGTITPEWLDAAREGGINRLSFGMQAFQPRLLAMLGRIHDYKSVEESFAQARQAGFENLNLDLIFGLPTQTMSDWKETLESALSLQPEHISAYGLIPEPGTPLFEDLQNGSLVLPEEDTEREMYDVLLTVLPEHRFSQYEISNFSLPERECLHNIGYWDQIPYLGLGVSSASMVLLSSVSGGIKYFRYKNTDRLDDYFLGIRDGIPRRTESEWISPAEARFENMMLGLRMNKGIDENQFFRRHGVALLQCYGPQLKQLEKDGFLRHEAHQWRLTRKGMDLQNYVLLSFMEDA